MSRRHRRNRRFTQLLQRLEPFIARMAGALSEGDQDLRDDLAQVGRIAAWQSTDQVRRRVTRLQLAEFAALHAMRRLTIPTREEPC